GASNESSFALRIIPACCLTIGNDRSHRLPRSLVSLLWWSVVATASARVPLVASSVVAVVAAVMLRTSVSAILLWPLILLIGVALRLLLLLLVLLRCRLICVRWGRGLV